MFEDNFHSLTQDESGYSTPNSISKYTFTVKTASHIYPTKPGTRQPSPPESEPSSLQLSMEDDDVPSLRMPCAPRGEWQLTVTDNLTKGILHKLSPAKSTAFQSHYYPVDAEITNGILYYFNTKTRARKSLEIFKYPTKLLKISDHEFSIVFTTVSGHKSFQFKANTSYEASAWMETLLEITGPSGPLAPKYFYKPKTVSLSQLLE